MCILTVARGLDLIPYQEQHYEIMMIMVAGTYRYGTGDDFRTDMEIQVAAMEAFALPCFGSDTFSRGRVDSLPCGQAGSSTSDRINEISIPRETDPSPV